MTDWSDDDFVDVLPARAGGRLDAPLRIGFSFMGKARAARLILLFAPSVLDEIGGPRYGVQFNPKARVLRVRAGDDLPYEAVKATRGETMMLRCPVPPGLHPAEVKGVEPEFYVNTEKRLIDIEVPDDFGAVKMLAAPPPKPAPRFLVARPLVMSGVEFPGLEADMVRLLASVDLVTTAKGQEELGVRAAEVADLIAKVRLKLEPLGIYVSTVPMSGYRVQRDLRAKLKRMVDQAGG